MKDYFGNHLQSIVVTNNHWEDSQGDLQLFERISPKDSWKQIGEPIPVVLGKNGMAWGIGLHPVCNESKTLSNKVEGDLKSPAGIFSLGSAFGFLPKSQIAKLKMEYIHLNEYSEAIDDPSSRYYNCIVNRLEVIPDWTSSEVMKQIFLYEIGLVVHHNWPQPIPGRGSAIFFHIWRSKDLGTAGCTAMSRHHLEHLLFWLDPGKNPLLIQLPKSLIKNEWSYRRPT
jgi:hypothetical protein